MIDYQTYSPIETTCPCCSNMVKLFYCTHVFPTMQGQHSHLAQVKKCCQRWDTDLDKMHLHPQNLFKGCGNNDNQTAGMGEPQTAMTQFWSENLIIPISQNKQMNQNQQTNPLSMKRVQRNVLVTKTPIDVLHYPEHNGGRTSLIKQASACAECGKNAMHVWETSGIQMGCGQTCEGAPMYLHALCTTWNE